MICIAIPRLVNMEKSYTEQDWELFLSQRFKVYQAEEYILINSIESSQCNLNYAKLICDSLRNGDVPHALRMLYREAVYGTNQKVKEVIKNRMDFIVTECM